MNRRFSRQLGGLEVDELLKRNHTSREQILATLAQFGIRKAVMVNQGWYTHQADFADALLSP